MKRKLFKDFLSEITKEDLMNIYITENNSAVETAKHYSINVSMLMRILRHYGIKKPNDLHIKQIKLSKLKNHGSENYNNHQKTVRTNLEKYGVENQFQREDLFPRIQQIKLERYGSRNNIQKNMETRAEHYGSIEESYRAQQETYKRTCMSRYGVSNSAKLQETRDKIAAQLKATFQELYGCDNYWSTPDAKRSNGSKNSAANNAFKALLERNGIAFKAEQLHNGKWYDFEVGNSLIEINPAATHNSTWSPYGDHKGIDKNYHKNKSQLAADCGYFCIHVFDWDDESKIINKFKPMQEVRAEACEIKEVGAEEAKSFLNAYHPQNSTNAKVRLGLFFEGKLVELMTFGNPRFNKNYQWELLRLCARPGYHIIGGKDALFGRFKEKYGPSDVLVYCDLSKLSGKIYESLGFRLLKKAQPSLHWYNPKTGTHITNTFLWAKGFDRLFGTDYGKQANNNELMLLHGFVEIYDCGQATFVWGK